MTLNELIFALLNYSPGSTKVVLNGQSGDDIRIYSAEEWDDDRKVMIPIIVLGTK